MGAVESDLDWQDLAVCKDHLWDLVDLAADGLATAASDAVATADPDVTEAAGLVARWCSTTSSTTARVRRSPMGWPGLGSCHMPIRRWSMVGNRRRGGWTVRSST